MDATDLKVIIDILIEVLLLRFVCFSATFDLDVQKFDLLVYGIICGLLAEGLLVLLLIL